MTAPRMLPTTAGALLVDGTIYRHSAVRGDVAPDLHPLVRRFLHELPTVQRERYAGWCAEAVLVSDRLYAAEGGRPGSLSAAQARAALWGARLTVVRVREPGDPDHGGESPPCRSCAALLDWCGIEVPPHEPEVPPRREGPPDVGRWALEIAARAAPDGQRHHLVPPALDAYRRFAGASALPEGPGAEVAPSGYAIDPLRASHTVATLAAFGAALGARVSPLGVECGPGGLATGILAIDERSRVFVLDATAEWFLGATVEEALETLRLGRAPARVRGDGAWT